MDDREQPRVLVVDDETLVGRSLRRALRGSSVDLVSTGREAIEYLCGGASYDVVFCDLMMPDVSGMDVYGEVCKSRPEMAKRFVFMTGGAFTPRAEDFLQSVPNRRLDKPFASATARGLVRDRFDAR